jgi:hypothetical protein
MPWWVTQAGFTTAMSAWQLTSVANNGSCMIDYVYPAMRGTDSRGLAALNAGCAVSDCNQNMVDHLKVDWESSCRDNVSLGGSCAHSTEATLATNLLKCACAYGANPSKYSGSSTGLPRNDIAGLCTYSECTDYVADMVAITNSLPKSKQAQLLLNGLSTCPAAAATERVGGDINFIILIGVGVVVLVILLGVGVCCYRRQRAQVLADGGAHAHEPHGARAAGRDCPEPAAC